VALRDGSLSASKMDGRDAAAEDRTVWMVLGEHAGESDGWAPFPGVAEVDWTDGCAVRQPGGPSFVERLPGPTWQ
jgi:hypothetical protein